ncbi:unnamed protein product, partial [Iphiclides podalirius]
MNIVKCLLRTGPTIRSSFGFHYNTLHHVLRPLSTATISPITKPTECAPPLELDKLYKRVELEMRGYKKLGLEKG